MDYTQYITPKVQAAGNLLGFDDIIGSESFLKAIGLLEQKLTAKEAEYRDIEEA